MRRSSCSTVSLAAVRLVPRKQTSAVDSLVHGQRVANQTLWRKFDVVGRLAPHGARGANNLTPSVFLGPVTVRYSTVFNGGFAQCSVKGGIYKHFVRESKKLPVCTQTLSLSATQKQPRITARMLVFKRNAHLEETSFF